MNETTQRPVALYARVSTEDQAERQTVQNQLDFLRRFCDLHQVAVADEYIDDGISGTVPLNERPEGRRLLVDAEAGRFGAVLVYRLDRLGRSLAALLTAHRSLDGWGVAIRSATEPFDTASPIGRFVFQLLGSIAELERESIQERMTLGRDRAARQGKYTGGIVALGYDVDEDGYLVPSARPVPQLGITEAELVRDIFERIAAGGTLVREGQRLQSLGVASVRRYANGGEPTLTVKWSAGRLADIIHNPVYRGQGIVRSRHGEIERPVPGLVEPALWDAAQAALTRNRKMSKKNAKRIYLLRGLIVCERCGMGFSGTVAHSRTKGEIRYYRCNSLSGASFPNPVDRCGAKAIDAEWLEGLVWDACREFIRTPGEALADAQRALRERLEQTAGNEDRRRHLLNEIAGKETERERVLTLYRRGRITTDEAEDQLDEIAREAGALREMLESLRAQEALATAQEAHLTDATAMLLRLRDRLDEVEAGNDTDMKREIVGMLVRRIGVETTQGEGRRKGAAVTVRYAFGGPSASIVSATDGRG